MVVETGERVDGRTAAEIRPIMVKGDYLPLVHGSGLFPVSYTHLASLKRCQWDIIPLPLQSKAKLTNSPFPFANVLPSILRMLFNR